jgi:hypothetical protein
VTNVDAWLRLGAVADVGTEPQTRSHRVVLEQVEMAVGLSASAAERSAAETHFDFHSAAPPQVRTALGMSHAHIAGGVALSMRNDPIGCWNRAMGFGLDSPVTADLIEEVCSFYRAEGSPYAEFLLPSLALPDCWDDICAKFGLVAGPRQARLVCDLNDGFREDFRPTSLHVAPVQCVEAHVWASALIRAYGTRFRQLTGLFTAIVDRPGWLPFACWIDDDIVSTGALHIRDDIGHCFGGTALRYAEGLGGPLALLSARAKAARAFGCRWLLAETAAEQPEGQGLNRSDMLRLGFRVLHERQSWHWRSEAGDHWPGLRTQV